MAANLSGLRVVLSQESSVRVETFVKGDTGDQTQLNSFRTMSSLNKMQKDQWEVVQWAPLSPSFTVKIPELSREIPRLMTGRLFHGSREEEGEHSDFSLDIAADFLTRKLDASQDESAFAIMRESRCSRTVLESADDVFVRNHESCEFTITLYSPRNGVERLAVFPVDSFEAIERALNSTDKKEDCGLKEIDSPPDELLFARDVWSSIEEAVAGAFCEQSIFDNQLLCLAHVGRKVLPAHISVRQTPSGERLFDDQGLPMFDVNLVSRGILRRHLLSLQRAHTSGLLAAPGVRIDQYGKAGFDLRDVRIFSHRKAWGIPYGKVKKCTASIVDYDALLAALRLRIECQHAGFVWSGIVSIPKMLGSASCDLDGGGIRISDLKAAII